MGVKRDDVLVLLKVDEVYRPSVEARKFCYSDELARVVAAGTFFETYPLDSDERFWVNEVATYYEMLATLWEEGVVDEALVIDWAGTMMTWKLIGPLLVQARDVFDSDRLWTGFEALAKAQSEA